MLPELLQLPTVMHREDGRLLNLDYDDVYSSLHGSVAQAETVFLGGSELPRRWRRGANCRVLELGFGLGINFLTTWSAWASDPDASATLDYVAIDAHPLPAAMLRDPTESPLSPYAEALAAQWPLRIGGFHLLRFAGGRLRLILVFADVEAALAEIDDRFDAIYLDGFAPAHNPAMWTQSVLRRLRSRLRADAWLTTYASTAGLKQGLAALGFEVQTLPGFAGKRERLRARLRFVPRDDADMVVRDHDAPIAVVGAGIAGLAVADALGRAGCTVDLFERETAVAQGCSAHHQVLWHPGLAVHDDLDVHWKRAAWALAWSGYRDFLRPGALEVVRDGTRWPALCARAAALPADYVRALDPRAASDLAGLTIDAGALYFPGGGAVNAAALLAHLRDGLSATVHSGCAIDRIDVGAHGLLTLHVQRALPTYRALVLCTGAGLHLADTLPSAPLRGQWLRGQWLRGQPAVSPRCALIDGRYVLPTGNGDIVVGATHQMDRLDTAPTFADRAELLSALPCGLRVSALSAEGAGIRRVSPDRRPQIGPLAGPGFGRRGFPQPSAIHAALCLGARGFSSAFLAAEILSAQLTGRVSAVARTHREVLDPRRYWRR